MTRFVIFANGEAGVLSEIRSSISRADATVVCADGGAIHALEAGVIPHTVVGDFDSLEDRPDVLERLEELGVELIRYPADKDETDLELALDFCSSRGASSVEIFCAFGGRLDHLLANVFLLAQEKFRQMNLAIADGRQTARLLREGSRISVEGRPGQQLSLIPLSSEARGVSIIGTKWILREEILHFGSTRGISNCFSESRVEISLEKGFLLVVT